MGTQSACWQDYRLSFFHAKDLYWAPAHKNAENTERKETWPMVSYRPYSREDPAILQYIVIIAMTQEF